MNITPVTNTPVNRFQPQTQSSALTNPLRFSGSDTVYFGIGRKKKEDPKPEASKPEPVAPPPAPAQPEKPAEPVAKTPEELISALYDEEKRFQAMGEKQRANVKTLLNRVVQNETKLETLRAQEQRQIAQATQYLSEIRDAENGLRKLSVMQLEKARLQYDQLCHNVAMTRTKREKQEQHLERISRAHEAAQIALDKYGLKLQELHFQVENYESQITIAIAEKDNAKLIEEIENAITGEGAVNSEYSKLVEEANKFISEARAEILFAERNGTSSMQDVELAEMAFRAEMAAATAGGADDIKGEIEKALAEKQQKEKSQEKGSSSSGSADSK